jgi:hypothetical protein
VDAGGCEAVVAVGLEAMEEGAMGHREAVASEVVFEGVVAEAMRHIEECDYQLGHRMAKTEAKQQRDTAGNCQISATAFGGLVQQSEGRLGGCPGKD